MRRRISFGEGLAVLLVVGLFMGAAAAPCHAEEPKAAPKADAPKAEPKPASAAEKPKPPAPPPEKPKPAEKPKPPPAPPPEPQVPYISYVFPAGGQAGKTVEVTVGGLHVAGATAVRVNGEGASVTVHPAPPPDPKAPKAPAIKLADGTTQQTEMIRLSVTLAADAAPGQRDLRVVTPGGISNRFRFFVGRLAEVNEIEPNSEKREAQRLDALPVVVNGQVLQADRDVFRVPAKAGQTLVFAAQAREVLPFIADAVPAWLKAVLTLYDADGHELAYVDSNGFDPDPVLVYPVAKDGDLLIEIKDSLYRGREDFLYRLTIGAVPRLARLYPLGGRRGTATTVELHGVNLPEESLEVRPPADAPSPWHVSVERDGLASNALPFDLGDAPEVAEAEPNDAPAQAMKVKPPLTINGRIDRPGDVDCFTFAAGAKQALVLEVRARRLGSPLDSVLTLLDAQGKQLAQNDDTVDEGEPLLMHHADSRLAFTFPAAGEYTVRIADAQGKGGPEFAYRLTIAPPRPDFALRVFPDNVRIGRGDTAAVTAGALRKDGFDGEIRLTVTGLPAGFVVRGAVIPPKEAAARFTITAPADAPLGLLAPAVTGTATVDGHEVVRTASPAELVMQAFSYKHRVPTQEFAMAVAESEFFTLAAALPPDQAVEVPQGGDAQVTVKIARGKRGEGSIRVYADQPPRGITVKSATVPADKDEVAVTLTASKTAVVGSTQTLVLAGMLRVGKDGVTRVTPAVPVKVVAPPPDSVPPPAAPPKP